jgi:hypothetical protein
MTKDDARRTVYTLLAGGPDGIVVIHSQLNREGQEQFRQLFRDAGIDYPPDAHHTPATAAQVPPPADT